MIKSFTKLYSDFWINYDNSEVIRLGVEAQLMALYLQGNSHHNILGVYYLPLLYIASDLRLPIKKVQTLLRRLISINYCKYDKRTQYVWVCNLALDQLGKDIDIKDNRIKAIHAIWESLPSQLEFLEEIYQKDKSAFHLEPRFSDTSTTTLNLATCTSKNIEKPISGRIEEDEDIEEIKGIKNIVSLPELKTELAIADANLNITIHANDVTTEVVTGTSQSTNTVAYPSIDNIIDNIGEYEGRGKTEDETKNFSLNIGSPKSLPIFIPPFEGSSRPLSRVLEPETMKLVVEEELLNPLLEVSALFLKDTHEVAVLSQEPIFDKNLLDGFSSKGKDMVLQPPSKGLTSPFIVPSKGLRSPFGSPSEVLRSNIDYRIENIENRNKNKEKEIEERRKEKTKEKIKEKAKKRDSCLNHVPILDIVTQTQFCSDLKTQKFSESSEKNFVFFENPGICSTTVLEPVPALVLEPKPKLKLETQSEAQTELGLELKAQLEPQQELGLLTPSTLLTPQLVLEPEIEPQPRLVPESKACSESQLQPQLGLVPESQPGLASASELPLESMLALQPESGLGLDLHLHPEPVLELELEAEPEQALKPELKQELKAGRNVSIKSKKTNKNDSKKDIDDSIAIVFSHWKTTMRYSDSHLDPTRKTLIGEALRWGYTVQQLCDAVTGCSKTSHNTGKNEQGQHYNGLQVILGKADQIDRFIRNCHNPPKPFTGAHRRLDANVYEAKSWVKTKLNESVGIRDRY